MNAGTVVGFLRCISRTQVISQVLSRIEVCHPIMWAMHPGPHKPPVSGWRINFDHENGETWALQVANNNGLTNNANLCFRMVEMDAFPKIQDLHFYPKFYPMMHDTHQRRQR